MMNIQDDICDKMFKVDQFCGCNIRITDTAHSLYDQNNLYSFSYKDTMTLNVVIYHKSTSDQLYAIVFTDHNGYLTEVNLPLSNDGWYTIYHIILPTDTWYYRESRNRFNKLSKYRDVYVTNGKNVYRLENGELVKLDILNFITEDLSKTTAHIYLKDIFTTCYLEECYISICEEYIKSKEVDLSQIQYKRDFIWCSLEILRLLKDNSNLNLAQSLIEEIMSCKGFCFNNVENQFEASPNKIAQYKTDRSNGVYIKSDCGCNK